MKKEHKIFYNSDGLLVIDGKEYCESITMSKDIEGIKHVDKTLFKKFDRKSWERKIDFVAKKISESLDKDEIIKELIKCKALNEIDKIYQVLKGNKKKKITKQKGCIGIKVGTGKAKTGGAYLQLIE